MLRVQDREGDDCQHLDAHGSLTDADCWQLVRPPFMWEALFSSAWDKHAAFLYKRNFQSVPQKHWLNWTSMLILKSPTHVCCCNPATLHCSKLKPPKLGWVITHAHWPSIGSMMEEKAAVFHAYILKLWSHRWNKSTLCIGNGQVSHNHLVACPTWLIHIHQIKACIWLHCTHSRRKGY